MTAAQSLWPTPRGAASAWPLPRPPPVPPPTVVVCEAGTDSVGRVRVSPSGPSSIHIEDLVVQQPHRGQGLGARLLAAAFELGRRWGRGRAWLEADDTGSGRLIEWYRRLGFQPAGRGPHGRPLLEARAARALPVIRRELETQAGGRPSYTLRAVPVTPATRTHP
ncbi:N-acetyltransferase [Myxococcus sp. RHSTA-1-4]|uniref:GNAT family N-acetyltransferase n=1 Tax=Myxococcus sp. RHSTA-1-4 TaxID=2874601 RepID=UPI001CBB408B|nr:GNAT family N-acetyltransferase [Myxococcus sp. RHSTA-1-4]